MNMSSGKGGLNIKDYPFAFSITTLLFPSIIITADQTVMFGILIVGGFVGTILTIVNPFGIFAKYIYIWTSNKKIIPEIRKTEFINKVVSKNFHDSFSSPSISFETDKLVAMSYFIIVLGIALYRLVLDGDFTKSLNLDEFQRFVAIVIVVLGLVGVSLTMISNIVGRNSVNHLRRIESVTTSCFARDIVNLSSVGREIVSTYCQNNNEIIGSVLDSFKKFEDDLDITFEKFKESFNHVVLEQIFSNKLRQQYNREVTIQNCWHVYKLILPMHKKYNITFDDMRLWFRNTIFFNRDELDSSLNQLNPSIESRDWYASVMNSFRFRDDFRVLLNQKNMLQNIV